MNRWAHSYVVGAVSGTSLIVAAVIGFMLLVSLQALQEWPVSGIALRSGNEAAGGEPSAAKRSPATALPSNGNGPAVARGHVAVAGRGAGPATTSAAGSAKHRRSGLDGANATAGGAGAVAGGVRSATHRASAPGRDSESAARAVPAPSTPPVQTGGGSGSASPGGSGGKGASKGASTPIRPSTQAVQSDPTPAPGSSAGGSLPGASAKPSGSPRSSRISLPATRGTGARSRAHGPPVGLPASANGVAKGLGSHPGSLGGGHP